MIHRIKFCRTKQYMSILRVTNVLKTAIINCIYFLLISSVLVVNPVNDKSGVTRLNWSQWVKCIQNPYIIYFSYIIFQFSNLMLLNDTIWSKDSTCIKFNKSLDRLHISDPYRNKVTLLTSLYCCIRLKKLRND